MKPPASPGEILLAQIGPNAEFDGYTNPAATQSKIIHDVQAAGDHWFNTGDLVRRIDVGFALLFKHHQFVDCPGDTFGWRAENISTNEVGEILNPHTQITMANFYGVEVPGAEGRSGMVAFSLDGGTEFDLAGFQSLVDSSLPPYTQPVFVHILRAALTTVTCKLLKDNLREHSYQLDRVAGDAVYVRKPRSARYERLDAAFYQQLIDGSAG